ncbi:hypothetical protein [Pseudomonas protegens]|uniref:hypothetical protein n=1 Tax=Pseudomonas protegens TaxID=380021 RepID=UPI00383B7242
MMQSALDIMFAQMRAAETVLQQLDSTLETIRFDPTVPISVETAINQTLTTIDELLTDFRGNPVLEPLMDQLKSQYVETIEHKVKVVLSQPVGLQTSTIGLIAGPSLLSA